MAAVGQSALQMVDAVFEELWCYLWVSTCPLSLAVIHFDSLMDIQYLQYNIYVYNLLLLLSLYTIYMYVTRMILLYTNFKGSGFFCVHCDNGQHW